MAPFLVRPNLIDEACARALPTPALVPCRSLVRRTLSLSLQLGCVVALWAPLTFDLTSNAWPLSLHFLALSCKVASGLPEQRVSAYKPRLLLRSYH